MWKKKEEVLQHYIRALFLVVFPLRRNQMKHHCIISHVPHSRKTSTLGGGGRGAGGVCCLCIHLAPIHAGPLLPQYPAPVPIFLHFFSSRSICVFLSPSVVRPPQGGGLLVKRRNLSLSLGLSLTDARGGDSDFVRYRVHVSCSRSKSQLK